jgi:Ca2+-transporting ATPase
LIFFLADIPPAMALGVEPREKDLMQRPPRNPEMGVLTKTTWVVIFTQSMLIAILSLGAYLIALHVLKVPLNVAQSMVRYIK